MFVSHLVQAAPPPAPLGSCTPGVHGIPGGFVGSLMCGSWAQRLPHTLTWVSGHRWHLAAALTLAIAARIAWGWLRRRTWARHAAKAVWVEVVPAQSTNPASTVHLWRLLAALLPAPSWWTWRPARLVWEVQATPTGMRCGIWIPPGINPTAVRRVLETAWPGVRFDQTAPPRIAPTATAAGLALIAIRPEWFPLVDLPEARHARRDLAAPEEDLLRGVYDGLAAAGRTGGGLLQVTVGRAPGSRVAVLRRATINPIKARRPHGSALLIRLVADGVRAAVIGVLNLLSSGPSSRTHTGPRALNPAEADAARQARTKYATAPHLLVAVTATGLGPALPAARAAAADILGGFALLSGHFSRRRLRKPIPAAMLRHTPAARMLLATVTETAALAGVPAEPAAYGLPSAAARQRSGSRDTFGDRSPRDERRERPGRETTPADTDPPTPPPPQPHTDRPRSQRPRRPGPTPPRPTRPRPGRPDRPTTGRPWPPLRPTPPGPDDTSPDDTWPDEPEPPLPAPTRPR